MKKGLLSMAVGVPLAALALSVGGGCGRSHSSQSDAAPADVLVLVGDSALTMREVLVRIPDGLTPEDSTALFHSIVDGWLERMLLEDVALQNADDLDEINRMVESYRRKLLVANYRRKLRESSREEIAESKVKEYFEENRSEMVLERPVVKGLYVKLPADAGRLGDVRRWMVTATADAIDNLERYGLTDAIEYSFFEDRWTDWEVLARQIPYRFGNPDEFVKQTRDFETTYGGMTYFLHLKEYIPSGGEIPYEVARPMIEERLQTQAGDKYEEQLINGLYRQAQKSGKLKIVTYDPLSRKMLHRPDADKVGRK